MSINSRSKGQRGEREIVKFLQEIANDIYPTYNLTAPLIERNQNQSWRGGYDIVGLDDIIAPEVKLCQTYQLDKWWQQAVRQANKNEPVLFYRRNRTPWRVRIKECVSTGGGMVYPMLIDISMDDFKIWLTNKIKRHIEYNKP